jgi:flavin reductase (DIM6/NTAB) family NADH-FMN oxidoreductase RutF
MHAGDVATWSPKSESARFTRHAADASRYGRTILRQGAITEMKEKISLAVNKRWWKPSPLLGQIVLVTSANEDGQSNVAPKSWISMMGFEPSMLALGCNLSHWTAKNILERHEYVVNVPGDDLVGVVWQSHRMPHPRPVESIGLTPMTAQRVKPPLIAECRAHLECTYLHHVAFDEVDFQHNITISTLTTA